MLNTFLSVSAMGSGRLGGGHDRRVRGTRMTDVRGQGQACPLRGALKSHLHK